MQSREDIKPKNLSVHEFLLRKAAVKLMVSEHIVEKVLAHEKKGVNAALKVYNEVEMSGFGKFLISQVKLTKKIKTLEKIIGHLEAKEQNEEVVKKIQSCKSALEYYRARVKPKEDEDRPKRVGRGVEEYLLSSQRIEGGDRECVSGADENM